LKGLVLAHKGLHVLFHVLDLALGRHDFLVFELLRPLLLHVVLVDVGFSEVVSHLLGLHFAKGLGLRLFVNTVCIDLLAILIILIIRLAGLRSGFISGAVLRVGSNVFVNFVVCLRFASADGFGDLWCALVRSSG
jgi:hypothetical protein